MKKIISFIVILIAYTILGAALVLGTDNFGLGFGDDEDQSRILYANALDRAGNIYYISDNDGEKTLTSVDSSGKLLFERALSSEVFGDNFYIGGIYVEHDMNIYMTVYRMDETTRFVTEASVHLFYEDGTYVDEIFREEMWVYPGGSTGIISALSEDDDAIYFALMRGETAEVFRSLKDNSEPTTKIESHTIREEAVYGWFCVPGGDVLVGGPDGIAVYRNGRRSMVTTMDGAIFDRFWNGIGLYYAMDSQDSSIYVISADYSISSILDGKKIIGGQDNLSLSDMSETAVGITGNLVAVHRGTSDRVYYGSFSMLSHINTDNTDKAAMINVVLALTAVIAAVLLLTVLTWDFFCSILNMRLSILLRQSLLIAMLVFVGLYSLSYLFIIPQVENIVTANYSHEVQVLANSFEKTMSGVLLENGVASAPDYEAFLAKFGSAVSRAEQTADYTGDDETPSVSLIEAGKDGARLMASGDLYPKGYPANRLLYGYSMNDVLADADGGDVFLISRGVDGERLHLFRRMETAATSNPVYIAVGTDISGLSDVVDNIGTMINMFLVLGGVIMVGFFMIIENITAGAVRKLKRSVDRIAGGEYTSTASIHTGDEVEELSLAVNALSEHIVEKTTSLEQLNQSYYRFVPLEFLRNLGETKIEKVSKNLNTRGDMTTMYLRMRFDPPLTGLEPQELFDNINSVLELVAPIVAEYGGTAYTFHSGGFNAIFADSTERALQAAIKIREVVASMNEASAKLRRPIADVRIVIGRDEVLLGFIGHEKRMEPTAISSAINESEEIGKICTPSGIYIAATQSAFEHIPAGKYRSRCIGDFVTASTGKQKLYDLFDSDPYGMVKLKEQFMTRFELGVNLFMKQDYLNARSMFMDIVKYASEDGVARNYMYLSEHNLTSENQYTTYTVYKK